MNKMQLEILVSLPKRHFDAVIKLLNNKVTDDDLKPMFPENWNHDSTWPEFNNNYDSFRYHQLQIDAELERQVGCYDTDDDLNYVDILDSN